MSEENLEGCREYRRLFDEMMRQYCPGRDEAFELALEVLGYCLQGPHLSLLEAGAGCGVFLQRVVERFPDAQILAVDRSALAIHVGQALLPAAPIKWQREDLGNPGWLESTPEGTLDAVFTGWMTHELPSWRLQPFYEEVASRLRPGGLLLNVDFTAGLLPGFREMAERLTVGRVGAGFREFSAVFASQEPARSLSANDEPNPETRWITWHTRTAHLDALRAAGFQAADEIWRYLNSSLIAAIR